METPGQSSRWSQWAGGRLVVKIAVAYISAGDYIGVVIVTVIYGVQEPRKILSSRPVMT